MFESHKCQFLGELFFLHICSDVTLHCSAGRFPGQILYLIPYVKGWPARRRAGGTPGPVGPGAALGWGLGGTEWMDSYRIFMGIFLSRRRFHVRNFRSWHDPDCGQSQGPGQP